MNKNILIVHYNTPRLTECLVKSINKFVDDAIIYIFDNSDKYPFTANFDNVTIIDNTKGQIIDFDKWLENYPNRSKSTEKTRRSGSARHCYSVETFMQSFSEPFVLIDSDVLLKRDITDLYDDKCLFVGEVATQPKVRIRRVLPFVCFINTKQCKKRRVHYFDDNYMHGLMNNSKNKISDFYDTGAGFFVHAKIYPYREVKISNYCVHYKGGSWDQTASKNPSTPEEWLNKYKKYWDDNVNKKVIYTCITGGYDTLQEPSKISEGWDYVCFTDDTSLQSSSWDIRPLPIETDELSQVKKQRFVKINPHIVLPEYDTSIWVDGSVKILDDLNEFEQETSKQGISVYVPKHPQRNCTYAEARAVLTLKKDKEENVKPQMERYEAEGFPKNNGMLQSNIMLRYHNDPGCIKLMETWFSELRDNSHRDQLSFNYSAWKNSDVPVQYMDKNICKSKWFKWNTFHKGVKKVNEASESLTEKIRTFSRPKKIVINAPRKRKINMSGIRIVS